MQGTLTDRLVVELTEPVRMAQIANLHAEVLWRTTIYAIIQIESTPEIDDIQQDSQIMTDIHTEWLALIVDYLSPLTRNPQWGRRIRQYRQAQIEEPIKRRQTLLEECRRILSQVSLKEKIQFLEEFREKGLQKTVSNWQTQLWGKPRKAIIMDNRFRY